MGCRVRQEFTVEGRTVVLCLNALSHSVRLVATTGTSEELWRVDAAEHVPEASGPLTDDDWAASIAACDDLTSLRTWLASQGAVLDSPTPTGRSALHREDVDLRWLEDARRAVEQVLDWFLDAFRRSPYLHRTEESLHAELFAHLRNHPHFAERGVLADGQPTQVVHKEWPETVPRPKKDADGRPTGELRKRGNFDIAVLAPTQLVATTRDEFLKGYVDAPIVIEVGLDDGFRHLDDDREKLRNSDVRFPYLLHLSRIGLKDDDDSVQLLRSDMRTRSGAAIRGAYAHTVTGDVMYVRRSA